MKKGTIEDFKKGMRVRYVPNHANGDTEHPDCQDGVVRAISKYDNEGDTVFVLYDDPYLGIVMKTGDEPYTAQGTDPENLRIIEEQA